MQETRDAQVLRDATTGQVVAEASSDGIDFRGCAAARASNRRAGAAQADVP